MAQCPCSIWQNGTPSGAVDAADTSAVNLGLQFQASSSGFITGVRFYKEPDNTGSACRQPVDFDRDACWPPARSATRPPAAGRSWTSPARWRSRPGRRMWRPTTPIPGHYGGHHSGLASAVTNGPLTALASGGVYAYGSSNGFPSSSYKHQLLGRRGVLAAVRAGGTYRRDGDRR